MMNAESMHCGTPQIIKKQHGWNQFAYNTAESPRWVGGGGGDWWEATELGEPRNTKMKIGLMAGVRGEGVVGSKVWKTKLFELF